MKEMYMRPQVAAISFVPNIAIAQQDPEWGWEDGVFDSTPEARIIDDTEGGEHYEG